MNAREFRDAVGAALEQIVEDVNDVHHGPRDSVTPPCFLLRWGPDPWREPAGVCFDTARLEVVCIVPREDIRETADLLDDIVDLAATVLTTAGFRPAQWLAPAAFEIGKATYLAAIARLSNPVSIGGT